MHQLRVRGLRSLEDTGHIRIAPITVLLGENSSGKSTFLRTFPLLRQSVEARTSEPLLWFGRLVDFGTFEESVSSFIEEKAIEIDFSLDLESSFAIANESSYFRTEAKKSPCLVQVKIVASTQGKVISNGQRISSYVSQFVIETCETRILLKFDSPTTISYAEIDGNDLTKTAQASYGVVTSISPTPTLYSRSRLSESSNEEVGPNIRNFTEEIYHCLKSLVHGRTTDESLHELTINLQLGIASDMLDAIKESQIKRGIWKKQVLTWTEETPEFIRYRQLLWAVRLVEILDAIEASIQRDFNSISYITPLRAAAERYYRQQGLAVNELDSKGENFAPFLRSLNQRDRESLKKWLGLALNVYVELEESKGHISLYLVDEKSKARVNLADTGFGYSQLLPIAIQLWLTQISRDLRFSHFRRNRSKIVVIEQPELHLHPRIQAKVADLLAHTISIEKSEIKPCIIVETHSEALVNRLGKLIADKILKPSDVNIVIFNKKSFSGATTVTETSFDSNGFLINWPLGFFNSD